MSKPSANDALEVGLHRDPELLQSLLGISDLLVVALDDEARILLFNRACEVLTGYSASEVVGRSIWSTLIPEDEVPDVRMIAGRLQTGEPSNEFTNHWLTRDGEKRLIHWRNATLKAADGTVRHVIGTGIDITKQQRAVESRRQHQNQLRHLLDALPSLVAQLDRNYKVRFVNQGYREWFGLDPQLQLGKHVCEVIGDAAFATLQPYFDQALAGEQSVYHGEVAYALGGTRFIHGTYLPAFDDQGCVDGLYILAVDLTTEHRLKWKLTDELLRSQTIIDTAIDGIITINQEGIIQGFNPAAERIFGYRATELMGANLRVLMPEPDRSRHDHYLRNYRETGIRTIIGSGREVTGLHKDGTSIDLQLAVTELVDNEHIFVGFIRDISQRKRAEREARMHLAELAHVTRVGALSEVTSGLAHEISQPLTAISAMTEACRMMIDNPDADSRALKDALVQISKQGQRAKEIIEQLRAFLRKEQPERMAACEPKRLVENVLMLLKHEFEVEQIDIRLDLDAAADSCHVNRVQVEQVLFNLIKNAIDALRGIDGSKLLTVTSRRQPDGRFCEFQVIDNGPGFAAELQDNLFHPFFTTKAEGLGQGLSICRSIVRRHGGQLSAHNRPEGGAVFRFTLPMQPLEDD